MYIVLGLLFVLLVLLLRVDRPEFFDPTCNKTKIFTRIRFLEDKLDELQYDIYKLKTSKKNNKMERDKNIAKNANKDADKLRLKILADSKKEQKKMDTLLKNGTLKKELEEQEAQRAFEKKKNAKLAKTMSSTKKKINAIEFSGSGKTSGNLKKYMSNNTTGFDKGEKNKMQNAIKNLKMPPGFVF